MPNQFWAGTTFNRDSPCPYCFADSDSKQNEHSTDCVYFAPRDPSPAPLLFPDPIEVLEKRCADLDARISVLELIQKNPLHLEQKKTLERFKGAGPIVECADPMNVTDEEIEASRKKHIWQKHVPCRDRDHIFEAGYCLNCMIPQRNANAK